MCQLFFRSADFSGITSLLNFHLGYKSAKTGTEDRDRDRDRGPRLGTESRTENGTEPGTETGTETGSESYNIYNYVFV